MRPVRRRTLLAGGMALAALAARPARAEDRIALWPGPPPGPLPARGSGPDSGSDSGPGYRQQPGPHGIEVLAVARPALIAVRPARPNGAAMLVAGGGGYRRIETGLESLPAAAWLATRGITAYVLIYRLPREGWSPMAPLQDAQRAMRLIRGQPGIDPGRLGVLGFSAGGHLVGLMAARAGERLYPPVDDADSAPAPPVLAGLIYPVISLLPPNDDTSTRRVLVGSDRAAAPGFSIERQVTAAMPPVFLAQAIDDPIAPVDNTLLMVAACRAAGVPVEAHLFQTGRHGWGMGTGETAQWPGLFAAWLGLRGF